MPSSLSMLRRRFLDEVQARVWGLRGGVPNNADSSSAQSIAIAKKLADVTNVGLTGREVRGSGISLRDELLAIGGVAK
jgi:hypothetical protein